MTEVRKADPAARRQAAFFFFGGALAAGLLISGFDFYGMELRDWLLAGSSNRKHRVEVILFLTAFGLSWPLVAFAAYCWRLGTRVRIAREYPPPGHRVIHDTPVVKGQSAISRARGFKALALFLGLACLLLCLALWRAALVLLQ